MDKLFLTQVFGHTSGYVYEYIGSVPENENKSAYVIEEFNKSSTDKTSAKVVVELPRFDNKIVLYTDTSTDVNQSTDFVLVTDLIPDPIPEPIIPPEIIVEQTPEESTTEESAPIEPQSQGQ